MKDLGTILFLLLAGPGFLYLGIRSVRTQAWRESAPALEVLIDRAVGVDVPPRTAWDRRFARFQAWMFVAFGSFFSLCLAAVLFTLFVPE